MKLLFITIHQCAVFVLWNRRLRYATSLAQPSLITFYDVFYVMTPEHEEVVPSDNWSLHFPLVHTLRNVLKLIWSIERAMQMMKGNACYLCWNGHVSTSA